jgi:type VI secretion system secreted protein Hcp
MAVDYFLKIDGISGESADDKHKGDIEVQSFSWGAANQGTFAMGGGGGAGKVNMGDFTIRKYVDVSSPKLIEACTTGKHISSVVLVCRKQGGSQQEYMKVTLTDVLVSGYVTASQVHQDDWISGLNYNASKSNTGNFTDSATIPVPGEEITLNFGKIEYEYREQDGKGGMKGPVKTVWDAKANKAS